MGLTATDIGRDLRMSAQIVNLMLRNQGILQGDPNSFTPTEKGKQYVSYADIYVPSLGGPHPTAAATIFDDSVRDVFDTSPEQIRKAVADRAIFKAQRVEEAEKHFQDFQASLHNEASRSSVAPKKVWIGIGIVVLVAGVSCGAWKYGPAMKVRLDDRRARRGDQLREAPFAR